MKGRIGEPERGIARVRLRERSAATGAREPSDERSEADVGAPLLRCASRGEQPEAGISAAGRMAERTGDGTPAAGERRDRAERVLRLLDHPAATRASLIVLALLYFFPVQGFGITPSYTVTDLSMASSLRGFWYLCFDRYCLETIDKPPLGMWLDSLFARLAGISDWALCLPEGCAMLACVVVFYRQLLPRCGLRWARLAAVLLGIFPTSLTLAHRQGMDALLLLLLLLAAWILAQLLDHASGLWSSPSAAIVRRLVLALMLIGLGFMTKTLEALLALPSVAITYLRFGGGSRVARLARLLLGLLAGAIVAGWWFVLVDMMPRALRPYVAGSGDGTELGLLLGWNGVSRLVGSRDNIWTGLGPAGPLRLLGAEAGPLFFGLLPLALLALLLWPLLRRGAGPWHLTVPGAAPPWLWTFWGAWLAVGVVVLSGARFVQPYYLSVLSPAVAIWAAMAILWLIDARARALRWLGLRLPLLLAALLVLQLGHRTPGVDLPELVSAQQRQPLLSYLAAHYSGEPYLLATPSQFSGAFVRLASGREVLALGGYTGADPILDGPALGRLTQARWVRFVLLGTSPSAHWRRLIDGGRAGAWVRAHCRVVPRRLWYRPDPQANPAFRTTLYDCRPPGSPATLPPPGITSGARKPVWR